MRAWVVAGRDPAAEASRQVCLRLQTQVLSVAWYREAISVLPHTYDVLVRRAGEWISPSVVSRGTRRLLGGDA